MHLECQDHDPPIRAADESGQHYYDLPRIREEVANRAEVVAWADGPDGYNHWRDGGKGEFDPKQYFRAHSAAFLRQHPHCDIRIITEYGEDVTEEDQA